MKKLIPLLSACCLLCIFSCRKEILLPDSENEMEHPCLYNCDTSKLNIVWQAPLDSDTAGVTADELILFEDLIICSGTLSPKLHDPVKARNKKTGELVWEWTDYHFKNISNTPHDLELVNDNLVVCTWHDMHVVDPMSGVNKWTYTALDTGGAGSPRISKGQDEIFHIHQHMESERSAFSDIDYFVSNDLTRPAWDTLVKFEKQGDVYHHIEPPSVWNSPRGDEMLIFILYRWNLEGNVKEVDFYCYNRTLDSIAFTLENFDPAGFISPVSPPLIVDGMAYVCSAQSVTCINLKSQKVEWQRKYLGETLGGITPQYYDGKIIFTSNQSGIRALDAKTGATKWFNSLQGASPAYGMVEYKGVLYYTSCTGKLHAVELSSGKELWAEKSPYNGGDFCFSGIALDEREGLLYATDHHFIYCINLSE